MSSTLFVVQKYMVLISKAIDLFVGSRVRLTPCVLWEAFDLYVAQANVVSFVYAVPMILPPWSGAVWTVVLAPASGAAFVLRR